MTQKTHKKAADYIQPINMNGLKGRMLKLPAQKQKNKKREILFVYGHHSSLERWWGVIQDLNQYGTVTVPDLPGFGGMDSFYKLGKKPTIDNLADYLASFIKLKYRSKKIVIAGLSFGFVIVTRMLQRHPELVNKAELLVSVVGFTHKDEFTFSKSRRLFYLAASRVFSMKLPSVFFRNVCLHPSVIRLAYDKTHNAKHKFKNTSNHQRERLMNFEVFLWHCNDPRTWMYTSWEFLHLNNCDKQIDLPVWHVFVKADKYFDNRLVEQHMSVIFEQFNGVESKMAGHAPSVIADPKEAEPLIPKKLRKILSR